MHGMETESDGDQEPNSPRDQPSQQEHTGGFFKDPANPIAFLLGADHGDTHGAHVNVTPIRVAQTLVASPFGTPTSRVGFPSTAGPSCAAGVMAEKDVDLATDAGCTALSGGASQ